MMCPDCEASGNHVSFGPLAYATCIRCCGTGVVPPVEPCEIRMPGLPKRNRRYLEALRRYDPAEADRVERELEKDRKRGRKGGR